MNIDPSQLLNVFASGTGLQAFDAARGWWTLSMRDEQLARYLSMRGQHVDQVAHRIRSVYEDEEVRDDLLAWVDHCDLVNPHGDIVRQLACAYARGAVRLLAEATPDEEEAYNALNLESMLDARAEEWNRIAYGVGPVAVVPAMKGGRLRVDTYAPHRWMPVFDAEDPEGPLEAAILDLTPARYDVFRSPWQAVVRPMYSTAQTVAYAVVDREAWRYYNAEGKPSPGPGGESVVPHNARDENGDPLCPVAVARVDAPDLDDWWRHSRPRRMWMSTIAAGVQLARLLYVRQYQDGKILASKMPADSHIENGGVIGHAAKPVSITGRTAAAAALEAVDFATPPDEHLRVLNFIVSAAALGEGLPPETVTISAPLDAGRMPGLRVPSIAVADSVRSRYQSQQIHPLRLFEHRLALARIAVARGGGHRLAGRLPPLDEAFERATIEFAELDTIDDPKQRREQDEWELSKGLVSRVDFILRKHPGWTRQQAVEFALRNVEEDTPIWTLLATRNQPAAGTTIPTSPAQVNGAMGPLVRDANNERDAENEAEDADDDGPAAE